MNKRTRSGLAALSLALLSPLFFAGCGGNGGTDATGSTSSVPGANQPSTKDKQATDSQGKPIPGTGPDSLAAHPPDSPVAKKP